MVGQSHSGWLSTVCRALDDAVSPVEFFFRNDDVGRRSEALWPLLALFAGRALPVDLAVIPALLSDPLATRLAEYCGDPGARVRVHQHGWRHENHETAGRKCEFGASRDAVEQASDLRSGRRRLQAALGPFEDPIFTPPWNRCVQATADLLAAEGYRVLSRDAGARKLDLHGLVEIPVSVDWQRQDGPDAGPGREIARAVAAGRPVGIMLHHAVMTADERARLGSLLDLLSDHEKAICVPMMACERKGQG